MRPKRHAGSNNRNHRGGGRGKYRSGGGGGNDSQSLARQKKHAMTQKEKYLNMARDAQVNGERVDAEYYYQHVEHYSRLIGEIIAKEPQPKERTEEAANDDSPAETAEADANAAPAEDAEAASEEAPAKPARGRRRAAPRKAEAKEIPLPASVIPEAEAGDQAAAQ